jgi:hypothetical protein
MLIDKKASYGRNKPYNLVIFQESGRIRDVADMYRLMKESTKPFCHHASEKQSGGVTLSYCV